MNKNNIHSLARGDLMASEKKLTLKESAREIFADKGYKATSISEIAKQARMAVEASINTTNQKRIFFSMCILMRITLSVRL